MKTKYLFLLYIITNINLLFSQHPDLQQGYWYVKSVTTNGTITNIPSEPLEFPYTYINFYNISSGFIVSTNARVNQFTDYECEMGFTGHVNYTSTNILHFQDFNSVYSNTDCNANINNFMNLYIDFFNNFSSESFTYTIVTEVNDSKTLTITNTNGDISIFKDTNLISPPSSLTNTWFLQNLIINGNNNIPPNNEEVSSIRLDFALHPDTPDLFGTFICSHIDAFQNFNISNQEFYLYNTSVGLLECSITENNNYQNTYFNFFTENLPGPFSYALSNSDNTLTITAPDGNQAIYANQIASIQDYISSKINIYPNPSKNTITIKNLDTNLTLKNMSLFNIVGDKIIQTQKKSVDISSLEKGVYFIQIKLENKPSIIKKVIKK